MSFRVFEDVVSVMGKLEVPCGFVLTQEKTAKINTLKIIQRISINVRWNLGNSCAEAKIWPPALKID